MKLLAIETSSERGSLALQCGDEITAVEIAGGRGQSALLMPSLDRLLSDAGISVAALDAIVLGCGPGSFTGVRLAAAVAQGIAMAADLGIVPVSSLAALAQHALRERVCRHVLACVDARMSEVYWAEYAVAGGVVEPVDGERLSRPSAVEFPRVEPWAVVGSGVEQLAQAAPEALGRAVQRLPDARPEARDVLALGRAALARGEILAAERAGPAYLRGESAWRAHE